MSDDETKVETPPAKPRKWLRRLRIAASVFFGLLTVTICVLWVRSYSRVEWLQGPLGDIRRFFVHSSNGWLTVREFDDPCKGLDPRINPRWKFRSESDASSKALEERMRASGRLTVRRLGAVPGITRTFQLPWLLPVLISGGLAAAAGISAFLPFFLRTLVIALTLVAVALGLGVWLAR